jgi:hypothetical protein
MRDEVQGVVIEATVATGHSGYVGVVGEAAHQDTLRTLPDVFQAVLVLEPDNPHDSNAIAVTTWDGRKIGYIPRRIASNFQPRLRLQPSPVTCPAKLTGQEQPMMGVVLDFEPVRVLLGLEKVSRDLSGLNYKASETYHKLIRESRELVKRTRATESSDPERAAQDYKRAVTLLYEANRVALDQGLRAVHEGYAPNQTDAEALNRLVKCLLTLRRVQDANAELDAYCDQLPHAREMTLVTKVRARIETAAKRSAGLKS